MCVVCSSLGSQKAESRKLRNGSQRHGQIHEKMRPAPPPARFTIWGPTPRREIKSLGLDCSIDDHHQQACAQHTRQSSTQCAHAAHAEAGKVQGRHLRLYRRSNAAGSRSSSTSPMAMASRYKGTGHSGQRTPCTSRAPLKDSSSHGRAFRAASQ